ncbi:MAG: TatD family hydrolase [Isosphaeraceae bacterium]|nr:TatD family hydrolase [Isosphaeraceae bacterium]
MRDVPPRPDSRSAPLIDTHAHLEDPRLSGDLPGVLGRARAAGVAQVVAIGTTAADSAVTIDLARRHPGVFAAVGIQPNHVAEAGPEDWRRVVELADQPGVVALGETGLDRYWDHTPFPLQQDYFDRHLALARERGLPVVIHCRNCERDIVAQLARFGPPVRGVLHSFTGTWDDAQAFLELGLDLSFAGMITFANKSLDPLREVAARVPLDRLLVETDSPYLSPHPFRGQTNEPARVALTAEALARLRHLPVEEVAHVTTANARRLFHLPEQPSLG